MFDLSLEQAQKFESSHRLSQEALKFEQQYLAYARTLIEVLNDQDPLLAEIDTVSAQLNELFLLEEREPVFQQIVGSIRVHLLHEPDPSLNDTLLQEWRRLIDLMNGALNRRQVQLQQAEKDT